jgi:peptidoglycan/xylan/chitin deacetylase (PgdA/CDA1 family)
MRASLKLSTVAGAAWALYALPALPGIRGPVRRLVGVSDRLASEDSVALTFDDGPHPVATPAILEDLAKAGCQATFFFAGEQVERFPTVAAEVAAAGHAIGIHCYRHLNVTRLTPAQLADDLHRAEHSIATATGRESTLYRPPYGWSSIAALRYAAQREWTVLLWSRHAADWRAGTTSEMITRRLASGLAPGEVMLLHDSDAYSHHGCWRSTVRAVPDLLRIVEAEGLRFVLPPPAASAGS